jgi:hypothetical protein
MRVLQYLKGTSDLGLVYKKDAGVDMKSSVDYNLVSYVDSDYAACHVTRKSTLGYVFVLNGAAVSWSSKKQKSVASSTVEAEYVAFHAASKEATWLSLLMEEMKGVRNPTVIFCDNSGCIANLKNHISSGYTKHIDIAYHAVRERFLLGQIVPVYITSEDNVADAFTKPLVAAKFRKFRDGMGLE